MSDFSRRQFLKLGATSAAALGTGAHVGHVLALQSQPTAEMIPAHNDPLLHLLNRTTWGARPADLAYIHQVGAEAYLEEQLHPETIDDSHMDAMLMRLPILGLDRYHIFRLADPYYRPWIMLMQGMILRAVHSKRQLQERMVEFWTDHFNIPSDELANEMIPYHNAVIRPHALGKFRDLLLGTAQSVPMLTYLDNAVNVAEHPNENWARELMELHTLGVDGGYTEQDVKEVARAFTGWTISNATPNGFWFDLDTHDTDEKRVLGHVLPAGRGIEDGLHVLHILSTHPATAQFVCRKLCRRFVSDQPPTSLIESAAAVFIETGGDVQAILRHIFTSREFYASVGQKFRRPLDFFIGALRVTGTEFSHEYMQVELLSQLAQLPYGWQPPNGYPDVAAAWISSSGLLNRWNTAMTLTHSAASDPESGMTAHLRERIGTPATVADLVDEVGMQVYAAAPTEPSRSAFIAFASDDNGGDTPVTNHLLAQKLATLFGLMLASPSTNGVSLERSRACSHVVTF